MSMNELLSFIDTLDFVKEIQFSNLRGNSSDEARLEMMKQLSNMLKQSQKSNDKIKTRTI